MYWLVAGLIYLVCESGDWGKNGSETVQEHDCQKLFANLTLLNTTTSLRNVQKQEDKQRKAE